MYAFFVMEGDTYPYPKAGMLMRENLCHVMIRDELSLMELSEPPFCEGLSDCFEVYF